MNKKDSKQIDYVTPQVIDLGISQVLIGQDCSIGQSNPTSCHGNGNRAGDTCDSFGSTAGGVCKNGDTAGGNCTLAGLTPKAG